MQTITSFSGSTLVPTKQKGFDFSEVSDGNIYKAVKGQDYATHKGFLTAMSRYANSNGLIVSRYVHPDGEAVEFQLTARPETLTENLESESSDGADSDPDAF